MEHSEIRWGYSPYSPTLYVTYVMVMIFMAMYIIIKLFILFAKILLQEQQKPRATYMLGSQRLRLISLTKQKQSDYIRDHTCTV